MFARQDRRRVGPTNPLGVSAICLARCLGIAPLGAVTMVGGSSDPSVPWSPGVSLQEKAGRPMGPSTLRCEFLWEIVVVDVGLVCWFFRFLFVLCDAVVISQGSVFCLCSFEPFTTRPVLGVCLRPSSFSVWFVSSATFFLSSLSQALGNPKPLWFGVPLVFLHPGHALRPRPVHLPPHIPQGIAPAPVFFFFFFRVVVARFWFGVFSFLSCRCRWSWGGYLVLVLVGLLRCFCVLSWPSGDFFFLLGWWGSPCRVFSSPCFLVRGGWVGDFCCFLHLASSLSCI